jgi:hypothetical protein
MKNVFSLKILKSVLEMKKQQQKTLRVRIGGMAQW